MNKCQKREPRRL